MAAKNKYDVILEKVGNQPLKTTKVLCSALGLGLAAAKGMVDKAPVTIASGIDEAKALDLKKQLNELGNIVSVPGLKIDDESAPEKKTASNKSAATDDAFDAIFGAGSAQKATPPVKSKATMKTEAKKTTSKTSAKAETKTTTSKTSTKSETKTTTKKKTAAASDDFDALFGGTTPKAETKSTTKKSTPKVVDKQVVIGEYFAELAQLRQGIKETGTYSGDGDMKPEIALAMYGDMDALFSCFKKQIITSSMRIDRSELEKQYKKLDKKIEKMKKASRLEKMIRCFSDDDQKVPCISYELALRCLRNNRPGSYLNYLYTAAAGGDPRAITYEQRYHSTNTNDANPFSWTFDIKFNGEFNFYQMFHYAVRGIGFDYSPYYPDSSIAIPASTFDEVNVNVDKQRAKSLAELLQTLSYFALPENIGTTEYKEHFGDFLPSELQIKIARHWFFIEDDRLVMSEETKKLRDEMKEKITNAVCNTPADAANTAKKSASAVKTATAETTSESESKTAPQIISLDLGDGDSYEGEMKDGKYHGMGTYRWGNGNVYTGEYVNGVRQGKGKFAFASGSSYEGEWKNGKYHGKGKWTNADGSYYTGVWENDDIIDSTKIEYPAPAYASESVVPAAGAKIERMEYDGGDFYEGEIVDGYRHGKGKYTWADGSEYEGDWVKGKKCGFGVYRSYSKNEKDGSTYLSYIYEGEWKDGKKHGQGIAKKYKIYHLFGTPFMTWSHEGGYANGDMHGHGIYKEWNVPNDTGRVHEGEWVNNKRQGRFVWEYEPSVTGKKYIDFYDQGHSVVFGIDYDPSINTLEEAKRVKAENDAVRDRVIAERRATEAAQDYYNKAMQARNNRDYFRCAYYLHRGGLCGDEFYRDTLLECYHPTGATGYDYVEKILTSKSLKYISDEDIDVCAFVLDKFVPKGTKDSKIYRAWCYYRAGRLRKAAGMIPNRGLMFYNGRIQDISEVLGGRPLSSITPYSDEIMANLFRCKLWVKLDMENDWVSQLRKNERLKEKLLLAEEYVKFAKKERWEYELREVEEDVLVFKAALR